MLKNYLKTAFRSLRKQGVFTLMNVIGLSTGIACFILITLFVRDELTFDRFHKNTDRIYRGVTLFDAGFVMGFPDYVVAGMKERMPEIEAAARIDFGGRAVMEHDGQLVFENEFYRADQEIFEIFDFTLLYGNEEDALTAENSLVISKYIMDKYFDGQDPVGQPLKLNSEEAPFMITGVLNDIPENSRFRFNLIARAAQPSFATAREKWNSSGLLYLLMEEGVDMTAFDQKVEVLAVELGFAQANSSDFLLEDYGGLYLNSNYSFTASGISGDSDFLWIFVLIGIVLLLIACINYINAATARALNRNKEIGVRRTVGASGKQIRFQFLAETACVTFLALLLSAGLVEVLLPLLNTLSGKELGMNYFTDPFAIPFLLLMVPLVTLLAGIYPALFSSRIKALDLFGKKSKTGKGYLRNSLVVFQFVITLTLIFCTQIIVSQVNSLQESEVGAETANIVNPRLRRDFNFELFKTTLEGVAGVEAVTSAPFPNTSSSRLDIAYEHTGQRDTIPAYYYRTRPDAADVFGIQIIQGQGFDYQESDVHENQVLISEKIAGQLPFENPIGQPLTVRGDDYEYDSRIIVGVYKNLNFDATAGNVPTIMVTGNRLYTLSMKLTEQDQEATLGRITEAWSGLVPNQPFEYDFLHDTIMANYEKERKFGTIFRYFAGVAVLIAALGLLGLSAFTVIQKYKEIGVRKVLGAKSTQITGGLLKKYIILVVLASLLAVPLAYFIMDQWLDDFANRITISADIFILGFVMSLGLLLVSVGYQTLKAGRLNPVKILKDE